MSGLVLVRVRRARASDAAARGTVLREGLHSHFSAAWMLFFFQEVTLQCVVLCGAVVFIFCGASLLQCLLLPPLAGLLVAAAVQLQHGQLADTLVQSMMVEEVGYVAEVCGGGAPPSGGAVAAITRLADGDEEEDHRFWQIIGTVSITDDPWTGSGCRLHALAVSLPWRRRGIGLSLTRAAADWWARNGGGRGFYARTNELQEAGRALLTRAGWTLTAAGCKPLMHGAMYLHVAHFTLQSQQGVMQ